VLQKPGPNRCRATELQNNCSGFYIDSIRRKTGNLSVQKQGNDRLKQGILSVVAIVSIYLIDLPPSNAERCLANSAPN
jgi:hypothetical protein